MNNIRFDKIEDYRDVQTLNEYKHMLNTGANMTTYMAYIAANSRDNGRTPMQWDSSINAGFTSGTPWIKVNPNYKTINVAAENSDPNSCLNYFKKVVSLRNNNKVLVYGKYTLLDKDNPKVYTYTREDNGHKMLIVLNFTAGNAEANIGNDVKISELLLSDYPDKTGSTQNGPSIKLRPYEALVYRIR